MLDEHEIIELITRRFPRLPMGYSQIGDDAALIPPGRAGEGVVLKTDMLVGRTDLPPGMDWRMAARKAVAMCVSDFASKGVRPEAFMVSLGFPAGTSRDQVEDLAAGLADASKEWRIRLVGGDTGEADDLVIDCMMVGFAKRLVPRGGARPGEAVVVSGTFGQTAAGLRMLMDGAKAEAAFRKAAVSSVCRPEPRLALGLELRDLLSSSIDSSDGLAISLHAISEMSGVGIQVEKIPYPRGLAKFASTNSLDAEELALYGGEEYEIVGTVSKQKLGRAMERARGAGCELHAIGETVARGGVRMADGREIRKDGWVHFSGKP
jgi:thiamine-monophosphate kinase